MPVNVGGYEITKEMENSYSQVVKSGLALHLDAGISDSYPGSGTTWFDLSGNGYNGTLTNGPTFSSTTPPYFAFDYTDDYITTSGMESYSYTNGITVSFWHYNGGGTGFYRGVATNGTVADRFGGFDMRYGREDYFGGSNNGTKLNWRITTNGTADSLTIYSNVNEWHNYIGTYDNTSIKVYKDGSLFDSKTHNNGGQLDTETASTTIGRSPGTSEYLDGRLGSIQIYDRALSATEIAQNFNATKNRYGL